MTAWDGGDDDNINSLVSEHLLARCAGFDRRMIMLGIVVRSGMALDDGMEGER